ncbi:MAG: HAD-IIIA family hydrolase [Candidatus Eisenbacteria bacterium]|nr:HAD-IIIA family hydrolase [Candidatus Eisenbacteria bacterium]
MSRPRKKNEGRPAVFLDRDGTVTRQVGYVNHPSRLRLYPFAARAIRRLNEHGIPVVIVTNQSGVARGLFPVEVLEETNRRMETLLARGNARVDGIYVCPHHPTEGERPRRCRCRKPETGLVRTAAREMNLDPGRSYVVGDSSSDILLGSRVGARTVLVLTGYGRGEAAHRRDRWKTAPDAIVKNLEEAVDWILRREDEKDDS